MPLVLVLLVATACSFSGVPQISDDPDAAVPDAAQSPDAAIDAGPFAGISACPQSLDLLACYLLDGDGVDGTGNGHDVTTETGIDYVAGQAGMAASFEVDDRMTVTESNATLDAAIAVTIEAWLMLDGVQLDASGRVGIFDKNGQYSLFVTTTGAVQCNGGGGIETRAAVVPIDEWVHVACAFDDTDGWIVYVNGVPIDVEPAQSSLSIGVNAGVEIGSDAPYTPLDGQYAGLIDNLLIWDTKRSRSELCNTSGIPCTGF